MDMAALRILAGYDTGAHAGHAFALGPVRIEGADPAVFGCGAAGRCGDFYARLVPLSIPPRTTFRLAGDTRGSRAGQPRSCSTRFAAWTWWS